MIFLHSIDEMLYFLSFPEADYIFPAIEKKPRAISQRAIPTPRFVEPFSREPPMFFELTLRESLAIVLMIKRSYTLIRMCGRVTLSRETSDAAYANEGACLYYGKLNRYTVGDSLKQSSKNIGGSELLAKGSRNLGARIAVGLVALGFFLMAGSIYGVQSSFSRYHEGKFN